MKIVVFGADGMVGSRVADLLSRDFEFVKPNEKEVDITDGDKLEEYLNKVHPQSVVNFAAFTDVNACEGERGDKDGVVWKVNAIAPGYISEISKKMNFFAVHISTDMVFPGSTDDPGPYEEDHKLGDFKNLTWYGASKAQGEKMFLEKNSKNAVVRIIYPVRNDYPQKLDYARKILNLYDEDKLYPMFDDQNMSITYVDELAQALKVILDNKYNGVFHVSSSDTATPYKFADYLLEKARNTNGIVKKSSFDEFVIDKDKRRYPKFGGLKTDKTQGKLSIKFSTWKEIIDKLYTSPSR